MEEAELRCQKEHTVTRCDDGVRYILMCDGEIYSEMIFSKTEDLGEKVNTWMKYAAAEHNFEYLKREIVGIKRNTVLLDKKHAKSLVHLCICEDAKKALKDSNFASYGLANPGICVFCDLVRLIRGIHG